MVEDEGYTTLTPEEERFFNKRGIPQKSIRFGVPFNLRAALIWTIFFAIIGIAVQSMLANTFVFADFFLSNYADWFRSFGGFVNPTAYASGADLFKAIMAQWYYFLYTGGLIVLIWQLVDFIINFQIYFRTRTKKRR